MSDRECGFGTISQAFNARAAMPLRKWRSGARGENKPFTVFAGIVKSCRASRKENPPRVNKKEVNRFLQKQDQGEASIPPWPMHYPSGRITNNEMCLHRVVFTYIQLFIDFELPRSQKEIHSGLRAHFILSAAKNPRLRPAWPFFVPASINRWTYCLHVFNIEDPFNAVSWKTILDVLPPQGPGCFGSFILVCLKSPRIPAAIPTFSRFARIFLPVQVIGLEPCCTQRARARSIIAATVPLRSCEAFLLFVQADASLRNMV